MWRIQAPITLIDLPNDFFIVKFTSKEDYTAALVQGPWLIGEYYLHSSDGSQTLWLRRQSLCIFQSGYASQFYPLNITQSNAIQGR